MSSARESNKDFKISNFYIQLETVEINYRLRPITTLEGDEM